MAVPTLACIRSSSQAPLNFWASPAGDALHVMRLTNRIGRHVPGVAEMVMDVLSAIARQLCGDGGGGNDEGCGGGLDSGGGTRGLLLLGSPGKGKTTLLRDVARRLADPPERGGLGLRVIVVDTSNEIAGDHEVPHSCIGATRRMMVANRSQQYQVMLEAVQNHTPQVLIVDEIGTKEEAAAAHSIASRGIALIATAHGMTLSDLLRNPGLSKLVGGVQPVTVGDAEARTSHNGAKVRLERKGAAVFKYLLELRGKSTWRLHPHLEASVDALLRDGTAPAQVQSYQQCLGGRRMLVSFDTELAARLALAGNCDRGRGALSVGSGHSAGGSGGRTSGGGFGGAWLVDTLHSAVAIAINKGCWRAPPAHGWVGGRRG